VKDTPLHEAVRHAHPEMIELLLDARASIHATNNVKLTPLQLAARQAADAVNTLDAAMVVAERPRNGKEQEAALAVQEATERKEAAAGILNRLKVAVDEEEAACVADTAARAVNRALSDALTALAPPVGEGSPVVLHSLSKAELNGAVGIILGPQQGGRWPVRLGSPFSRDVSIRPENVSSQHLQDDGTCRHANESVPVGS